MQALVHFTVGVACGLAILTLTARPVRQEFVLLFLSGFWAMLPDGHWLLREAGFSAAATVWRGMHNTVIANAFWFHHYLDSIETGRDNIEAGLALGVLLILILAYYHYNDWSIQ